MLRKTKIITRLLVLLLLSSIITGSLPSSSAGIVDRLDKAYALKSQLKIVYDESAASDSILPFDMIKTIPVSINYRVDGLYEDDLVPLIENIEIFIQLFVVETPEWCDATISPSYISVYPKTDWNSNNATLRVKVYDTARPDSLGKIAIKAKVQGFGAVKGGLFQENVSFTPGYLPLIKITANSETHKEVTPGEPANFVLELENLGNGITYVDTEVLNPPKDWTIGIESNILLNSKLISDDTKETTMISIVPPSDFGYHYETQIINIAFTPTYFKNASINGSEHIVSFIVKSRGFSAPGFESGLFFLVIILLTAFIIAKKKYKWGKGGAIQ